MATRNPEDHAVANANDVHFNDNLYLFQFGAYGGTWVYVWSDSLDSALEEAADWLSENAPGLLTSDEEMQTLYDEAKEEAPDEDEEAWQEMAETDMTYTEAGYIPSWEWHANEVHGSEYDAVKERSVAEAEAEDEDW